MVDGLGTEVRCTTMVATGLSTGARDVITGPLTTHGLLEILGNESREHARRCFPRTRTLRHARSGMRGMSGTLWTVRWSPSALAHTQKTNTEGL